MKSIHASLAVMVVAADAVGTRSAVQEMKRHRQSTMYKKRLNLLKVTFPFRVVENQQLNGDCLLKSVKIAEFEPILNYYIIYDLFLQQ